MPKPSPSSLLYCRGDVPLSCPLIEFLVCDLLGPVYPALYNTKTVSGFASKKTKYVLIHEVSNLIL